MAAPLLDKHAWSVPALTILESAAPRAHAQSRVTPLAAAAPRSLAAVDPATVSRLLAAAGVRWVRLEFSDLHGIARSKLVPLARFGGVLADGASFFGGALHADACSRDLPAEAFAASPPMLPEYLLVPDLSTLAVLDPGQAPGTARVVCDLCDPDGAPSPFSPRTAVRALVDAYAALGFRPRLGFEYEFVLRRADGEPVFADRQYAATLRAAFDPGFVDAVAVALDRVGVEVEELLVEAAPGQLEIPLRPADGLAAPDRAFAFRTTVKEVAVRHGYVARFMTKPAIEAAANGLHVHQSLVDGRTGANAFAAEGGFSDAAECFLAGQLAHANALCAFLAPTINCYKSFRPGTYAPQAVAWGVDDRRSALRVPRATGAASRIENRLGRAAADPYLATAALLAAGLDGIRRGLVLPPPRAATSATDQPALPRSLDAALEALEADAPLCALLPAPLVELYLTVKRSEVARCRAAVPDVDAPTFAERVDPWEMAEYGELI